MNSIKTTLLLGSLTGLFLSVGYALNGENGMLMALLFAGIMNFVSLFFSDKIVLKMYGAQPVSREQAPELYEIVERLAQKARIPVPRIHIIQTSALNAFATGRSPSHAAVAVTTGLLQVMNRDELEGVLAHELSHVLNRDTLVSTVAATLAGAVVFLSRMAMFFGGGRREDGEGANPLVALLMMILAPIAALLIQMAVSRSREFGADETGARLSGDPQSLASALQKLERASKQRPLPAEPATAHLFIVNPLSARALMNLFSTHPPTEARVQRLLGMTSR